MRKPRIFELDILRGIMALWVVLDHCLPFSKNDLPPALLWMERGDLAVFVFMILSGFVISLLLDAKHESYGIFMVRRFFRLYPAYVVILVASVFTFVFLEGANYHLLRGLPGTDLANHDLHYERYVNQREHLWGHLVSHLTMLHGAVPSSVLSSSATAILTPAWSISLEFQFYLVAPLIWLVWSRLQGPVGGIARSAGVGLGLVFLAFAATRLHDFQPSFIFAGLPYFFIGIFSYVIYRWQIGRPNPARGGPLWALAAGFAILLLIAGCLQNDLLLVVSLWLLTLVLMLRRINAGTDGPDENGAFVRLGKISYSLYLCHWPILVVAVHLALTVVKVTTRVELLVVILLLVPAASLACASLLYRWIERPGIDFGARLARSMNAAKTGP